MRTSIAAAVVLIPVLSACDKAKDQTSASGNSAPLPYRPGTAAEIFELRSRCVDLGQKILQDDVHGPALTVDMKSNYNARTNRCYVELDASKIEDPAHFHHETLFDGQTREILAFTEDEGGKKRAAVFAKNDAPTTRRLIGTREPPTTSETKWKMTARIDWVYRQKVRQMNEVAKGGFG